MSSRSSKDTHLYTQRPSNIRGGKPISSNNSLSFTSSLSSLINNSSDQPRRKHTTPNHLEPKPKKDNLFQKPPKRAKLSHNDNDSRSPLSSATFAEQKHTTDGERLEREIWEKSQRKMREKSRLYAAMKRGDVEDVDEKYTVDFDRKWAQEFDEGKEGSESDDVSDDGDKKEEEEQIEYVDEFGRTRTGTKSDIARIKRMANARSDLESDRYTNRPSAPTNIIRGDTIQHDAFQPDAVIADAMEELAKKRDRSLTPPPEQHFDSRKEVRDHGTGFFEFSGDNEERKRQMDELERERAETERIRRERGRKRADEFLDILGEELGGEADANSVDEGGKGS